MGGISSATHYSLPTTHRPLPTIPCLFTFLRTLLHFFALAQNSTLFFSTDSALFAQNTAGGGDRTALPARFADRGHRVN